MNSTTTSTKNETGAKAEAKTLRDLTPQQWKSGIAAWLGWLFDGLDQHLYVLVAAPFVAQLLHVADKTDPQVVAKSSWIQASFLIGWAIGGAFFGRLGDLLGRSRALSLTILFYAMFTGLSYCAATWWQLLIFRFLAALGIGGEWAVGASLLSETWPRKWGPWIAAVLQTGVNIGVMLASAVTFLMAGVDKRYVFLVGIAPAFLVLWIRSNVPEPEEWHAAKTASKNAVGGVPPKVPGVLDLFGPGVLSITLKTIVVCACSLSAWWGFLFWNLQHMRNLPSVSDAAGWSAEQREQMVSTAHFLVIGASTFGNFACAWIASKLGYRRAIFIMLAGFLTAFSVTFWIPRDHVGMLSCIPFVGFCSGVFGLFTMYMPPLFPVLLRTTGAGFCYNIGRVFAAAGTVYFGLYAKVGDFRVALFYAGMLFVPAMVVAWFLPDHEVETGG